MTDQPSETPPDSKPAPAPAQRPTAAIIVALTVVAIVGISVWYLMRPQPLLVQGEADATRIDIAARVDGRVLTLPFDRGDNVKAGQVLVTIDNPELLTSSRKRRQRRRSPRPT